MLALAGVPGSAWECQGVPGSAMRWSVVWHSWGRTPRSAAHVVTSVVLQGARARWSATQSRDLLALQCASELECRALGRRVALRGPCVALRGRCVALRGTPWHSVALPLMSPQRTMRNMMRRSKCITNNTLLLLIHFIPLKVR